MASDSISRHTVSVNLEQGLHLVPCSRIVQVARKSLCNIHLHNGDRSANAKNVLDIVSLNAVFGTDLTIEAIGEGAEAAVQQLVDLFESNFEHDP